MTRRTASALWFALAVAGAVGVVVAIVVAVRDARPAPDARVSPVGSGSAERLAQSPTAPAADSGGAATRTSSATEGAALPTRLRVRAIGVDAPVVRVGVDARGEVAIPRSVGTVGWYRFGAAPGSSRGSVVLVGHVDDRDQGAGAFFRLQQVARGDTVAVRTGGQDWLRYRVVSRERFPKSRVPLEALFSLGGTPRLTLITCGGSFDETRGSYRDNIVVTAVPS